MTTATKKATKTMGKKLKPVAKAGVVAPLTANAVAVVGTKTVSKPKTPVVKQPDPNVLVQFVTQRGRRVGAIVAIRNDDVVSIGTALCRRSEKFVQKQAVTTATDRAKRADRRAGYKRYLHFFAPSMVKDVMSMVYRCQRFYKSALVVLIPHRGSFTKGNVNLTNGIMENVQAFHLQDMDSLNTALPGYRDYAIQREADYLKAKQLKAAMHALAEQIHKLAPTVIIKVSEVTSK